MAAGIIGRKIGMMHQFDDKGNALPVTVIEAGPCAVVQKKTVEKDKYNAIQIGYEEVSEKNLNKAQTGHFAKTKVKPVRHLKEIRLDDSEVDSYNEGDEITVAAFNECAYVDVTGTSRGRGYAGVIKRHGFHRPKQTHGTHEKFRHGGSLGCRFPQRVVKGKKMAGHYGNEKVTTQSIKVIAVKPEENLILVKGAVPGPKNGIVMVRKALKK